MVSPFQAQQYSDPRIAVLQNAFNAQNQKQLQAMQNRNRTLNSALSVGGTLLKDYAERADQRRQADAILESLGQENFGGGKIGLDELTDYMTADTNAQNSFVNQQNVLAKTLPYLGDEEVMSAAQSIRGNLAGSPGGFKFGPRTSAPTVLSQSLGGGYTPAPASVDPANDPSGWQPVMEEEGTISTDNEVDSTIARLEGSAPSSPIMRERTKERDELSSAQSKAVSDRMAAKKDLRRDNLMGFFSERPLDVLTNKYGEQTQVVPNQITKAKLQKLKTAADSNDDKVLTNYTGEEAANIQMASLLLGTGSKILDIYSKEGFVNNPDVISGIGEGLSALGRNTLSLVSKGGFGSTADNKDLTTAFDIFTNKDAKGLAKQLEGGGRLSDFDFEKSLEQMGNMRANSDLFRRKFFGNTEQVLQEIITSEQALGNMELAEDIANQFINMGAKYNVQIEMGQDGVPRVVKYKDLSPQKGGDQESTSTPVPAAKKMAPTNYRELYKQMKEQGGVQ